MRLIKKEDDSKIRSLEEGIEILKRTNDIRKELFDNAEKSKNKEREVYIHDLERKLDLVVEENEKLRRLVKDCEHFNLFIKDSEKKEAPVSKEHLDINNEFEKAFGNFSVSKSVTVEQKETEKKVSAQTDFFQEREKINYETKLRDFQREKEELEVRFSSTEKIHKAQIESLRNEISERNIAIDEQQRKLFSLEISLSEKEANLSQARRREEEMILKLKLIRDLEEKNNRLNTKVYEMECSALEKDLLLKRLNEDLAARDLKVRDESLKKLEKEKDNLLKQMEELTSRVFYLDSENQNLRSREHSESRNDEREVAPNLFEEENLKLRIVINDLTTKIQLLEQVQQDAFRLKAEVQTANEATLKFQKRAAELSQLYENLMAEIRVKDRKIQDMEREISLFNENIVREKEGRRKDIESMGNQITELKKAEELTRKKAFKFESSFEEERLKHENFRKEIDYKQQGQDKVSQELRRSFEDAKRVSEDLKSKNLLLELDVSALRAKNEEMMKLSQELAKMKEALDESKRQADRFNALYLKHSNEQEGFKKEKTDQFARVESLESTVYALKNERDHLLSRIEHAEKLRAQLEREFNALNSRFLHSESERKRLLVIEEQYTSKIVNQVGEPALMPPAHQELIEENKALKTLLEKRETDTKELSQKLDENTSQQSQHKEDKKKDSLLLKHLFDSLIEKENEKLEKLEHKGKESESRSHDIKQNFTSDKKTEEIPKKTERIGSYSQSEESKEIDLSPTLEVHDESVIGESKKQTKSSFFGLINIFKRRGNN